MVLFDTVRLARGKMHGALGGRATTDKRRCEEERCWYAPLQPWRVGGWPACLPAWTSGVGQTKRKARGRSEASRSGSSEASISRHRSARDDRRLVPNPRPTRGPRCCAVSLGPNSRWLFALLRPATECHRTLLQPEADGRGQGFLYDPNFIITFIYNLYNFYLYLYYLVS